MLITIRDLLIKTSVQKLEAVLCHFLQPSCSGVPPWRRAEGWSSPLSIYIKVPIDAHDLCSGMEWVNAMCSCMAPVTIPCTTWPLNAPSDALTRPHQGAADANKGCSGFPSLCWAWSGVRIVSLGAAGLRITPCILTTLCSHMQHAYILCAANHFFLPAHLHKNGAKCFSKEVWQKWGTRRNQVVPQLAAATAISEWFSSSHP